jgi:hypothetical protein
MNKQNIFIIVSIIGIFIFAYAVMVSVSTLSSNVQENSYCNNWGAAIDDKNAVMQQRLTEINNAKIEFDNAGLWDTLNFDTSEWNTKSDHYNLDRQTLQTEIDDYNKQCVY